MSDNIPPGDPLFRLKLRVKSAQKAGTTLSLRADEVMALIDVVEAATPNEDVLMSCVCPICAAINNLRQVL